MFVIYDLAFLIFALFYLVFFFFRKRTYRGISLRLGILPRGLKFNRPLWLHAVSVGEVMAIKMLAQELRRSFPAKNFVFSTVTPTGNKVAEGLVKEGDFLTYLPFDLSFITARVLSRVNPSIFILAETEIWPNLISALYQRRIPVVVVNARISDRAFLGYLKIRPLIRNILSKISLFSVQTISDAEKFKALGVPEERIKLSGNMKFDSAASQPQLLEKDRLRQKLGLLSADRLFVCGSTHPGEEEKLLNVYQKLRLDFANLKLLIAPRHPERAQEVAELSKRFGLKAQRISLLEKQPPQKIDKEDIFILDTIGELINYYAIATLVFVGGSLVNKGGHNILEPASLGKPIFFGPCMSNFRDISELFLTHQAARLVHDEEELELKIREILDDPEQARQMSQRASQLIIENSGSTRRNLDLIKTLVS